MPSNIISVATYDGRGDRRRFVMRVSGEGTENVKQRVRDSGITVLD